SRRPEERCSGRCPGRARRRDRARREPRADRRPARGLARKRRDVAQPPGQAARGAAAARRARPVNLEALAEALGGRVERAIRLPGGASKEAWAVDLADGRELLVRRAGGGVIHLDTLTLSQEFDVLVAACDAGVAAPRPVAYL